ncbi:MAG: DUF4328 domain-containing protein [Acidimicrobiales bacterium]
MNELEETRTCPSCDTQGSASWKFCVACGANMSGTPTLDFDPGRQLRTAQSSRIATELDDALALAQTTLIGLGTLGLLTVVLLFALNSRLDNALESNDLSSAQNVDRILAWGVQPIMLIALIIAILSLVRWSAVSDAAARQIGGKATWFGSRASLSWFVPLVNLLVPPVAMQSNWMSASRSKDRGINAWIATWPLLLGVGSFLAVAGALRDTTGVVESIRANTWSGLGYALASIGVVVLALALGSVSTAQRRALPELPPPVPRFH